MNSEYNKDLTIIIPPNDGYLDVFDEYMRYFRRNWPDCPFELILVTQEKEYKDERVTNITTSLKAEWSERLLAGVARAESKYILTWMEDGFISEKINTEDILDILDFMKKHHIQYYKNPKREKTGIKNPVFIDNPNAYKIKKNQIYGVDLGYVIWDRDKILEVFGDGKKTAWQIEESFNETALHADDGYYDDMVSDKRNFLHIIETVSKGKWIRAEIKRLEELGMPVNLGNREKLPVTDAYRRDLHTIAAKIVPAKHRKTVKKIVGVLGYKFVTKN